jgi:tetratricopeptide (TPR) repeat protein
VDGKSGLPSVILEARRNATREVVFTQTYAVPGVPAAYEDIDAVGRAARDIAQPFGAILTAERRDPNKTDDIDCVLRAIDYSRKPGKDELRYARVCLKWMITSRPNSHLAYALLSAVTLEPYRDGYKPRSPEVYKEAIAMARMAVKLAPSSARAHHALMKALFVSGFPDDALAAGKAAIALNPNDAEVATEYGCQLIYRNRVADGNTILTEISDRISLPSVQFRFCRYLAAFLQNERERQKQAAASLMSEPGMMAMMAEALEASSNGNTTAAQKAIDAMISFSPGFAAEPRATLLRRGWEEPVADRVYAGLLEAGLEQRITTSGVPGTGVPVSPLGP